ncbi:MAG: hypothetical protein KatS3mg026_1630 [Bacteroidia bacterium]|nr:MAG: hypothetical protein KatS3mg026_1630 [Bacteroidia bacterium]
MLIGLLWLQQAIFLVGDAGALTETQVRKYTIFWQKHAHKEDVLIWLGDNIYPRGHDGSPRAVRRWNRLLAVSRAFPGKVYALAGNHDWKSGIAGLLREDRDLPLLPPPGQIGPAALENPPWLLIALDSELYIQTGGKAFPWQALDSLVVAAHKKNLHPLLLLHHPPKTAGAHGGYFPLGAHVFPLRILSRYLYLPLPGLGTAFILLRKAAHHPTDLSYPTYRQLSQELLRRVDSLAVPTYIASGHDHNLQVHRLGTSSWMIVSGSGCKTEPVSRRRATWARATVGLWHLTPTTLAAYALTQPDQPIWKFPEIAVP